MIEGVRALWGHRHERVSLGSLVALRVFIGVLVSFSAARFLAYGWVDQFFGQPTFFFHFWGFDWVNPLSLGGMTAVFWALVVVGLTMASGLFYRASAATALVLWSYVELIDVTNYLNHYVLMSLLLCSLLWMPAHHRWSLDRALGLLRTPDQGVARWMVWVLRFQVASVYFWAGMAKATPDWLIHAQPLNIWLTARSELPLLGSLFEFWWVALAMSWAGFLFDSTIWMFLLWRRTRALAFLVVVGFHVTTGLLFNIGLFPWIMILAVTVMFAPSWPEGILRRSQPSDHDEAKEASGLKAWVVGLLFVYLLVQVLMPMRHWVYPGHVLWNEQGMRWSWRVMVREKNGAVTYRVRWQGRARDLEVPVTRYLTDHQAREMSGQPDMILQLGQHIGRVMVQEVGMPVQVYVDALVSLNGRAPAALVDPAVDLMQIRDGVSQASWITPMPSDDPIRLR